MFSVSLKMVIKISDAWLFDVVLEIRDKNTVSYHAEFAWAPWRFVSDSTKDDHYTQV